MFNNYLLFVLNWFVYVQNSANFAGKFCEWYNSAGFLPDSAARRILREVD